VLDLRRRADDIARHLRRAIGPRVAAFGTVASVASVASVDAFAALRALPADLAWDRAGRYLRLRGRAHHRALAHWRRRNRGRVLRWCRGGRLRNARRWNRGPTRPVIAGASPIAIAVSVGARGLESGPRDIRRVRATLGLTTLLAWALARAWGSDRRRDRCRRGGCGGRRNVGAISATTLATLTTAIVAITSRTTRASWNSRTTAALTNLRQPRRRADRRSIDLA